MLASTLAAIFSASLFVGGIQPAAPNAVVITFDAFAVGYDEAWGEPAWSAQHETAASIKAAAAIKRNGAFHVCVLPDGTKSVSPDVYADSGYDLGHQTEAGSMADKPPTFGTCNMTPQTPQLNRMIWAGIEAAVRSLAVSDGDVYVVTGPQIIPGAKVLGGKVIVPAASWKAVYDPSKAEAGAYYCTNVARPVCKEDSLSDLTALIGFDPMPGLPVGTGYLPLPEPTKGGTLTP